MRTQASCQGVLGALRVRVEGLVGPGVPHPAPNNPMGICGNPSQLSPVSDTWGIWGWVSWVSPLWRSGSGSAGRKWPEGPGRARLLSQASSSPVPTWAPILQSY